MILDAMTDALSRGDRIEIRGFGSFALNYRPPRVGRNPKSGEKVQVPEKYVPHFKAGKELRERGHDGLSPVRPTRWPLARSEGGESRLLFLSTSGIISGMRLLIWIFRLFLFLLLFGFAVKNDDVVVLRFFFGTQWQVPLVLVILLFVVSAC
jgi:integration host factor beta subunit